MCSINPPQPFTYTDWVVKLPISPSLQDDQKAARKHKKTRVQRLIHFVDTRFGKGRCFYGFLPGLPKRERMPYQIEVSQLYAFHEVKHWPGAFAQLEWTSFVMANVEYDDLIRLYGPGANLTVPVLPAAALPVYEEMKQHQDSELASMCAETGLTVGRLVGRDISLYALDNPAPPDSSPLGRDAKSEADTRVDGSTRGQEEADNAMDERSDDSKASNTQSQSLDAEPLGQSPKHAKGQIPPSAHPHREGGYARHCKDHQKWVQHTLAKLINLSTRIVCRSPDTQKLPWAACSRRGRANVQQIFDQAYRKWRACNEQLVEAVGETKPETGGAQSGCLSFQLAYLVAQAVSSDPIPDGECERRRHDRRRRHVLVAMARQRNILAHWRLELRDMAAERTGLRYRRESGFVLDLWTGAIQSLLDFDADEDVDVDVDMQSHAKADAHVVSCAYADAAGTFEGGCGQM